MSDGNCDFHTLLACGDSRCTHCSHSGSPGLGLLHNFRSVMTGIGRFGFPQSWWSAPVRRLFDRLRMERFVTMRQLLQWKDEGKGGGVGF